MFPIVEYEMRSLNPARSNHEVVQYVTWRVAVDLRCVRTVVGLHDGTVQLDTGNPYYLHINASYDEILKDWIKAKGLP